MNRLQGIWRWAAVAAVALAGLAIVGSLMLQPAQARSGLDQARGRWNLRPFNAYRLQLAHETQRGSCEQEIVTRNERSGEGLRNTCGQPATWTVTRLFNWIAELERTPARCFPGPAFCACRGTTRTRVTYDPVLGYPREIIYEWHKQPNLIEAAYWRSLFDQSFPGCDKDGTGGPVVVRIALTPEP